MTNPAFTTTARASRVYVHAHCGTATRVDGTDFTSLANPYSPALATICCKCGPVSLHSVQWEETGETLADYRRRIRSLGPRWVAWLPLWLPTGCAALGAAVGYFTGDGFPTDNAVTLVYAGVGLIFGGVLGYALRPMLQRQCLGVDCHSID